MYQGDDLNEVKVQNCPIEMAGLVSCVEAIMEGRCPIPLGQKPKFRCEEVRRKVLALKNRGIG